MLSVAVVIRVRNAAADLHRALEAIQRQRRTCVRALDVIVVDNESSDDSAEVARAFGTRVITIGASEFSWGRALNWGIREATDADVAILLSADATPANEHWLDAMVRPFADSQIAAVYGRQRPRPNAPVDEVVRLAKAFDAIPRKLTLESMHADIRQGRWVCSNACAAIRRSVWVQTPFDEDRPAEEKPWLESALASGYVAVYEPGAEVFHSHHERVWRFAFREWEIVQNSRRGRPRAVIVARYLAHLAKRRVRHCAEASVSARQRLIGLARLPFEMAAVAALCALQSIPKLYQWARRVAW